MLLPRLFVLFIGRENDAAGKQANINQGRTAADRADPFSGLWRGAGDDQRPAPNSGGGDPQKHTVDKR